MEDHDPVLNPAPITLLNRMFIGSGSTAPRKELKGHDFSTPYFLQGTCTSTKINDEGICNYWQKQVLHVCEDSGTRPERRVNQSGTNSVVAIDQTCYYNVVQGTRQNLAFVPKCLYISSIPLYGNVANHLFKRNNENVCTTSQTSYSCQDCWDVLKSSLSKIMLFTPKTCKCFSQQ